jgi:hypothetical protein
MKRLRLLLTFVNEQFVGDISTTQFCSDRP